MPDKPTWLVMIGSAPYFSGSAEAGIDVALACGAFGQSASLLLHGEGLKLLQPDQAAPGNSRNLYKQIASLPLYDIEQLYLWPDPGVDIDALRVPSDELVVETLEAEGVAQLIASSTHVVAF